MRNSSGFQVCLRASTSRTNNNAMEEISDHDPAALLKSTVLSLEAEYRAYRRAVDRYYAQTERGLQLALHLLHDGRQVDVAFAAEADANAAVSAPEGRVVLTRRETQILKLIASGNSTKQAAFIMGIRFKTAVGHRSQLMKKLHIHDTASLVRFAIRTGLIEP
jgi:DNA-binding NarL/FixJ family response regulator